MVIIAANLQFKIDNVHLNHSDLVHGAVLKLSLFKDLSWLTRPNEVSKIDTRALLHLLQTVTDLRVVQNIMSENVIAERNHFGAVKHGVEKNKVIR